MSENIENVQEYQNLIQINIEASEDTRDSFHENLRDHSPFAVTFFEQKCRLIGIGIYEQFEVMIRIIDTFLSLEEIFLRKRTFIQSDKRGAAAKCNSSVIPNQ